MQVEVAVGPAAQEVQVEVEQQEMDRLVCQEQ
jgi:hypothetical protein